MGYPTITSQRKFTSGTVEELRNNIEPVAKAYNSSTADADNIISVADITKTLVGGATFTTESAGDGYKPRLPDFSATPFPGINNQPQSYSEKAWIALTTTTINTDGVRLSNFASYIKIDPAGDVSVLWKPASIGQILKVRVESSLSNYMEYTWTATSTNLARYTAGAATVSNGGQGVQTGTPDFNSVVSVFYTTSSGTSRIYDFVTANNKLCFVGSIITLNFDNISEFDIKDAKKYSDYGEFTTMRGANATEFGVEFDLTLSTFDPALKAAIEGKSWKRELTNQSAVIASPSTNGITVGASNYAVLSAGLDPTRFQTIMVYLDNGPVTCNLSQVNSNLKYNECFYDSVTGFLYFSNEIGNGVSTVNKAIYVTYNFAMLGNVLDSSTESARMFYFTVTRRTNAGIKSTTEYPFTQFQIVNREQKAKDPITTYKITGKAYFGQDPITGRRIYQREQLN